MRDEDLNEIELNRKRLSLPNRGKRSSPSAHDSEIFVQVLVSDLVSRFSRCSPSVVPRLSRCSSSLLCLVSRLSRYALPFDVCCGQQASSITSRLSRLSRLSSSHVSRFSRVSRLSSRCAFSLDVPRLS
jgi:hypothetical protein